MISMIENGLSNGIVNPSDFESQEVKYNVQLSQEGRKIKIKWGIRKWEFKTPSHITACIESR